MKVLNKVIALITVSVVLLNSMLFVYAESPVIEIYTPDDLITLGQSCHYDLYSKDKVIRLMNDIDLSGYEFDSISSFLGVFEGNRHTISGLNIDASGSNQGLFRYLEEGGIVRNLTVEGVVDPIGTRQEVGGLVGTNRGVIINCTFTGHVSGLSSVGGIVGFNETTGTVINAVSYGAVIGEHLTGGIVGNNEGLVKLSRNYSLINTTDETVAIVDNTYDLEKFNQEQVNSAENIESQTDTGGIAGFSKGILLDNSNYGIVGYQHVGYNIGGIVGRQSGYIKGCKNYGTVYGRKDVGGIVGQYEPYIRLLFSEDTLKKLDQEFQYMNELLETMVADAYASNNEISANFETVNQLMNQASNELENVLNGTTDFADASGETINEGLDRLHLISRQLAYVVDELKLASDNTTEAFADLKLGFDELSNASQSLTNGMKDIQDAFSDLEAASEDADKAMDNISVGLNKIQTAVKPSAQYTEGVALVNTGFQDLEVAIGSMNEAISIITDYYNANATLIGLDYSPVFNKLSEMQTGLDTAVPNLRKGFNLLFKELEEDLTLINEGMIFFEAATNDLKAMSEDLDDARDELNDSAKDFEKATQATTKAMDHFSDGMDQMESASEHISSSINYMSMIIEGQNNNPALVFPTLSDYVKEDSDSLFKTLNLITDALTKLNKSAKNGSSQLVSNLEVINDQYKVIAEIIRDGLGSLSYNDKALFQDVSDENLDGEDEELITSGYLSNCYNEGQINGDVDVGGIAGAMAIEYDFDPEDDIVKKGNNTFNFKYQTKAVLYSSTNIGEIISKKNYAGGIVGRMDLGLLNTSENYSTVKSTDGQYVGGIAGFSDSVIRSVYSKSELSGKDYIGGIAGSGHDIYDSYAIVNILDSNEYVGAIAGDITGELSNNKFVQSKWHGVDGISYDNQTKPLSFEAFIENNLPDGFSSFVLTYKVEGETVAEIPFNYGDSLDMSLVPSIPSKEGHYSEWPSYDYENLVFSHTFEAAYTPLIQVLSSGDEIKPQLLVEGVFDPEIKLRMNPTTSYRPKVGELFINEWRVAIDQTSTDAYKYRYLKPETDDIVKFYQSIEGRWIEVKTEEDGSYITFESQFNNFNLAVVSVKQQMLLYYVLGSILILIIITIIFKKKLPKKRTA